LDDWEDAVLDLNDFFYFVQVVDRGGLKEAAIAGFCIVGLPGYVCRQDVQAGSLRRVLPSWAADDTTITALIPYQQGLLPSVRVFLDHLATEFPKAY
jgi:DNA-binding transcriptional LysR family regulator